MCSLSVSQPGSNFSIGPLPFSSFPVFSVEDELESSASAADAAGEADAAWGDAAWPGRCRYCEGACRRLLRFQEHSRWRQFGGEGRAKVAGQGLQVASDAGYRRQRLARGALPADSALLAASASGEGDSDDSLATDEQLSSGDSSDDPGISLGPRTTSVPP